MTHNKLSSKNPQPPFSILSWFQGKPRLKSHIKDQFFFMGSIGSSGAEVVTIDVQEAKDLIKSGYGYMDVRTAEEFKRGYVDAEKIYNIPYMFNTPEGRVKNPQFLNEVASACSKEDRIVVGCQSGVRSLYAVADLQEVGYKHLSNMGGGYLAWTEKHFPVVKPEDVDQKKPEYVDQKKAEVVEQKKPEDVEQKKPEAEL